MILVLRKLLKNLGLSHLKKSQTALGSTTGSKSVIATKASGNGGSEWQGRFAGERGK
jgi:hypothetical protein